MRKLIAIVIFVVMASTAVHAETYLGATQDLVKEGKYPEALDRFVWFHNHILEQEPAMHGVRLSFALSDWKDLGDVYPPALAALKKTRDDKTDLVAQGKGNWDLFGDVAGINKVLDDDTKTVSLFRKLDQHQKEMAQQCWGVAKKAVIRAKAYDVARKYSFDPLREWESVKKRYDMRGVEDEELGREIKEELRADIKTASAKLLIEDTMRLIGVAIALNDKRAAKKIFVETLAISDKDRLSNLLLKAPGNNTQQMNSR